MRKVSERTVKNTWLLHVLSHGKSVQRIIITCWLITQISNSWLAVNSTANSVWILMTWGLRSPSEIIWPVDGLSSATSRMGSTAITEKKRRRFSNICNSATAFKGKNNSAYFPVAVAVEVNTREYERRESNLPLNMSTLLRRDFILLGNRVLLLDE